MTQMTQSGLGNTLPNRVRGRKWCFTVNNFTENELTQITNDFKHDKIIIGKEVGEEGTPHLQGYVEFKNAISFNSLKKILKRAHIEKAKGTTEDNIRYCSKESVAVNTFPKKKIDIIIEKYSKVIWKEWQQNIINLIEGEKNDRRIIWVFDKKGGSGKSFLCKYLFIKYNAIVAKGKKNDVFNQLNIWQENNPELDPKAIILDIPRHSADYINYGMMEELKDGLIYSGKYEGGTILFNESPEVIVFSNDLPDMEKWTKDRYHIITI